MPSIGYQEQRSGSHSEQTRGRESNKVEFTEWSARPVATVGKLKITGLSFLHTLSSLEQAIVRGHLRDDDSWAEKLEIN